MHTGLLDRGFDAADPDPTNLLFYRTVGSVDAEFEEAFADWPGRIYVATGGRQLTPDGARQGIRSLDVAPLWDLDRIGPGLRAIVHHGGHGITLRCLADQIPSVALPGHNPERLANGIRAASEGQNVVFRPSTPVETVWGAAVDETGDRPAWTEIRSAIDALPRRATAKTTAVDMKTYQNRLVNVLTAASHAP
ncbi:hypothetical protein N136_01892 [Leifsonia aquatica ATCC 14665]|uniref:Glycosyltransferase family 28 protein n=1 Tax=Leifsonia aquatica ATCC 14665 TaxID=1358026 RepID=U2RSE8_LEIAQ|nr:hypothetical protein N136_01892 [Leifsonia aquatica ATCC 14665]